MKKILCLLLCVCLLIPTLSACSKPPQYAEIEERLRELIEASAEVNRLFFGEGLPTYERIYDPMSTMDVHREPDPTDPEKERLTYYYQVNDKQYEQVVAFRSSYLVPYSYLEVRKTPDEGRTPYYADEKRSVWCYLLENYTEPEYDFFYDEKDPADYDYVTMDSPYQSVSDIKVLAEQVYSADYLSSIYDSMFVGSVAATETVNGLSARYIEYSDEDGTISLMESNTFEPLITETRVFDFSTAKIVKPSNQKYVNVTIDSYLPSDPSHVINVRLSLTLQNGVWMLDSATY